MFALISKVQDVLASVGLLSRAARPSLRVVAACALLVTGCGSEVDDFDDEEVQVEGSLEGLIIGADNRARVTQGQATAYPWRSVAAIRLTANMTTASCSAFKVGPRHLLSAAHCFYQQNPNGFGLIVPLTSFRIIFGQYGSGNAAANMPVDGKKVAIQSLYVPPAYISSGGTSSVDDWALIRVADGDSGPGWFKTKAWTTDEMLSFTSPTATGYPLHANSCAASPFANGQCSGYQYYAAASNLAFSASFIDTHADWQTGQSGGAVFGTVTGQSQKLAFGIIHSSSASASYARRITSAISTKVCQEIQAFPSTSYPNVSCTP
jgi:V8-like Glu-specific endopeptidase